MNDEQIKIVMEQQQKILRQQDDQKIQIDADRNDINDLRIGQATIKVQLTVMINTLGDFKKEIRQQVTDTLTVELRKVARKVIREEIRLLSRSNPKKVIEHRVGILETIKRLFKIR